jgi:hypothetical protein
VRTPTRPPVAATPMPLASSPTCPTFAPTTTHPSRLHLEVEHAAPYTPSLRKPAPREKSPISIRHRHRHLNHINASAPHAMVPPAQAASMATPCTPKLLQSEPSLSSESPRRNAKQPIVCLPSFPPWTPQRRRPVRMPLRSSCHIRELCPHRAPRRPLKLRSPPPHQPLTGVCF